LSLVLRVIEVPSRSHRRGGEQVTLVVYSLALGSRRDIVERYGSFVGAGYGATGGRDRRAWCAFRSRTRRSGPAL